MEFINSKLFLFAMLIFAFNVPFGMWRAKVKKFSWQWFASIHIPIPFIVLLRIYGEVGFGWQSYVYFVSAFFLGQLAGKWFLKRSRTG
jgi:hypothetical protein